MSGKKSWTFNQLAKILNSTDEEVRRWVIEDRTLVAVHVDRMGFSAPFLFGGLALYDVNDAGEITDLRSGRAAGFLRIENIEAARYLHERFLDANRPNPIDDFLQQDTSDEKPPTVEKNPPELRPVTPAPVVAVGASDGLETAKVGPVGEKPWLVIDPTDPTPKQSWYTPARFFARQLAIEKPTLLSNRELLAGKVSTALFNAGFKKRGGKLRFDSGTVLKAFANVTLG